MQKHISDYPDHFFKRKKQGKHKEVVIYRRNNLTFEDFQHTDTGYMLTVLHKYNGACVYLKLQINSQRFHDLFEANLPDYIKIAGGANHFGIKLTIPVANFKHTKFHGIYGNVSYEFAFSGTYGKLYLDTGKKKAKGEKWVSANSGATPIIAPDTVRWAATHPYQGGLMQPK